MPAKAARKSRRGVAHILLEVGLPAAGFAWGAAWATKDWPASIITGLAVSGTIFALYRLDRKLLKPRLEKVSRDWMHLGLEMLFSFLEHAVGALSALLVCSWILGFPIVPSLAWMAFGGLVVAFPIIHGTELGLRYYRQFKEKERSEEQLRSLATEAELKALKAQIDPHFLFNTLNTIAALTHSNPSQAESITERLAEVFRYVLNGSDRGMAPLREEVSFLEDYLEIERARFGERLRVTYDIAPEALEVSVPSLILQPLVENGVRHGKCADGRIDLTVRVERQGNELAITIADRGPGMPEHFTLASGGGYGLPNVDERLRKTYGEEYGLEITANQPEGTVVSVRIPD
jgi:signal transduction histidine kinase